MTKTMNSLANLSMLLRCQGCPLCGGDGCRNDRRVTVRSVLDGPLTLTTDQGNSVTLRPYAPPAQVEKTVKPAGTLHGGQPAGRLPIMSVEEGDPTDLPPREFGVYWVVPFDVAAARPDRPDLLAPYNEQTDPATAAVRCEALARVNRKHTSFGDRPYPQYHGPGSPHNPEQNRQRVVVFAKRAI